MSEERIEFKVKTKMSKSSLFEIEDLISYARGLGQEAIAITDYNSVDNFIKIYDYLKKNDVVAYRNLIQKLNIRK